MKFPKKSITTGRKLFRAAQVNGVLDAAKVKQIAQNLIEEKPRHYIPTLRYLQKLVRLEEMSRRATIESATPLDATQKTQLEATLAQQYGAGLNIEYRLNPALIGGTKVRVGSDVYDGSVQGRLARLKEVFSH